MRLEGAQGMEGKSNENYLRLILGWCCTGQNKLIGEFKMMMEDMLSIRE